MPILDDIVNTLRDERASRKKPVRIGLMGEGPEFNLVASAFRDCPLTREIIVYHPNLKTADKLAAAAAADAATSDLDGFMASVDAVEVFSHRSADDIRTSEILLRAGIHLSVRKPFAHAIPDAENLMRAATQGHAFMRIDDEAFFFEPYNRAKELIDAMEIGEPCAARFKLNLCGKDGWGPRSELLKSDNPLLHPCFDQFALAIRLLGDIDSVISYSDPFDVKKGGRSMIGLKFRRDGLYGFFDITFSPQTTIRTEGYPCDAAIEIAGTDGIMWLNHFYGKMTETPWIEVRRGKKYYSLGIGSDMAVDWSAAVRASAAHFVRCISSGRKPTPDATTHIRALRVLLAAREAAANRSEVRA